MTEESRATDIVERPLQPATDVARRLEMRVLALRSRTRQTAEIKYDVGLSEEAADEIASLRSELESARERADNMQAELERFKSEREYIVGCNDGWDEAALQAAELARSYWYGDKPHMKQWDEACVTISDEIEKMVSISALQHMGEKG